MRNFRVVLLTLAVALGLGRETSAQTLSYQLFERYLETLRQQAAIPGLSAAIIQNGSIDPVWETGLGQANVATNIRATASTPYVIGDASQVFASTLLLEKCADEGKLKVADRVVRWIADFGDSASTIAHLLTHTTAAGAFHYDLGRYSVVSQVIQQCENVRYKKLLANEIFDRFGMIDSVPGQALATPTLDDRRLFDAATLNHYASVLSRLAVPYRVDSRGNATPSDFSGQALDASGGVITTVRDYARFDAALDNGALLLPQTIEAAFTRATVNGVAVPTGLGWFVQNYDGEKLVWTFGTIKDAYSALVIKLPYRHVTLVLLANSDGLNSGASLENGDVTTSAFARLFFKVFGL